MIPGLMASLLALKSLERLRAKEQMVLWQQAEHWFTDQGAIYKWLRGDEPTLPVVFLLRPDETATANVAEMACCRLLGG